MSVAGSVATNLMISAVIRSLKSASSAADTYWATARSLDETIKMDRSLSSCRVVSVVAVVYVSVVKVVCVTVLDVTVVAVSVVLLLVIARTLR